MVARCLLSRHAWRATRQSAALPARSQRAMATASESYPYESGEVEGVKYASRDLPGPVATIAAVARAGTRYQPFPGFSEALSKFMYKSTQDRSGLRITRESELLGGQLMSYHTREQVVVGAKFLRNDLPYFLELLAEVLYKTKYLRHEFEEDVVPNMRLARKTMVDDAAALASDAAHQVAFHRGLGNSLHSVLGSPTPAYFDASTIDLFGSLAFNKKNYAIVANGASHHELSKWMGQFFKGLKEPEYEGGQKPEDILQLPAEQSKYFGGEARIDHDGTNTIILGFPGTSNFTGGFWKPEIPVLAALLGGRTTIKWSPGFSLLSKATESFPDVHVSTSSTSYSDAGLLAVTLSSKSPQLGPASQEAVKAIKKIASGEIGKEDFKKAVANAKFDEMSKLQELTMGLEQAGAGLVTGGKTHQITEVAKSIEGVTESGLKKVAQTLLEGKASVATVGKLFMLPYASDIGLTA